MSVKLLAEHHMEFLGLKAGCTGSSVSTLAEMPDCWKSYVAVHLALLVLSSVSPGNFGAYHLVEQQRLRQACAKRQTCQSLSFTHTRSIDVDEDSIKI